MTARSGRGMTWHARGVYPGGTLDPSRAWTVIPADHFGQRGRVGAYAVDPRTLDNLSAFVTQRTGPPVRYGTPRGGAYGYGTGGYVRRRPRRGAWSPRASCAAASARRASARLRQGTVVRRRPPRTRMSAPSAPSHRGAVSEPGCHRDARRTRAATPPPASGAARTRTRHARRHRRPHLRQPARQRRQRPPNPRRRHPRQESAPAAPSAGRSTGTSTGRKAVPRP